MGCTRSSARQERQPRCLKLRLQGVQSCEEHLFIVDCTNDGTPLLPEAARHLLDLPAAVEAGAPAPDTVTLQALYEAARDAQLASSQERNGELFDQEMEKLDRWATSASSFWKCR